MRASPALSQPRGLGGPYAYSIYTVRRPVMGEVFVNKNLGSSPGWWAATVATYCPCRPGNSPNSYRQNLTHDGTPKSVLTKQERRIFIKSKTEFLDHLSYLNRVLYLPAVCGVLRGYGDGEQEAGAGVEGAVAEEQGGRIGHARHVARGLEAAPGELPFQSCQVRW